MDSDPGCLLLHPPSPTPSSSLHSWYTSSAVSSNKSILPIFLSFFFFFLTIRYRVLDSYPAYSDMELALNLGDIIFVHKKREDGWYKGTSHMSGKTGLFPGSFVEKL